jgi:uncharacterized membrane protein SpoIIM required for sporulation
MFRDFFKRSVSSIAKRAFLVMLLNWLFFGLIPVGAFMTQHLFTGVYEPPAESKAFFVVKQSFPVMVMEIFFFNLILSAFVFVTLSGLAFFVLPFVFLALRGWIWGVLINGLLTSQLLTVLPVIILEGLGYVLAAMAGVNLGLSWLRPHWVYSGERLSRLDAIRRASKDCVYVYVLVAIFLFLAAVIETTIIFLVTT